jgi:hypothetical protein
MGYGIEGLKEGREYLWNGYQRLSITGRLLHKPLHHSTRFA